MTTKSNNQLETELPDDIDGLLSVVRERTEVERSAWARLLEPKVSNILRSTLDKNLETKRTTARKLNEIFAITSLAVSFPSEPIPRKRNYVSGKRPPDPHHPCTIVANSVSLSDSTVNEGWFALQALRTDTFKGPYFSPPLNLFLEKQDLTLLSKLRFSTLMRPSQPSR